MENNKHKGLKMNDSWYSIDEVATYLNVRRETIYRWIKNKNFPAHRTGSVYKSRISEVDAWVKADGGEQSLFSDGNDSILANTAHNSFSFCPISDVSHTDRSADFSKIKEAAFQNIEWADSKNILFAGDSLALLRKLPDASVSLIVTDPPYHSTQKSNIMGDTNFKDDASYLSWMNEYINEWKRVLRPNGSLYCFCSGTMAARLEVAMSEKFNILSSITWSKPNAPGFDGWKQKMNKDALRQWYGHSERIIFAEPATPGNLFRSYFGHLLHSWRKQTGMSMKDLAEKTGAYGKVNHGGSVANWEAGRNIPSVEQYEKIKNALLESGHFDSLPNYSDVIRSFKVDACSEFIDVWTFPNIRPYKGKHPAEKPIALLEHIIKASSYEGDIVLDCFSGSGTTAIAALKNNRLAVSIEIDPKWIQHSRKIFETLSASQYSRFPDNYIPSSFELEDSLL